VGIRSRKIVASEEAIQGRNKVHVALALANCYYQPMRAASQRRRSARKESGILKEEEQLYLVANGRDQHLPRFRSNKGSASITQSEIPEADNEKGRLKSCFS
jgi:hypothetical protein